MTTMKYVRVLIALLLLTHPAAAQWQVPQHAVPIGRGGGNSGFKSVVPNVSDLPMVSNGQSSDPSFRMLTAKGGGTGADNSASVANDVLSWTGTGFVHTTLLSLINTVCTAVPRGCAVLFGFYMPEWFGATPSPPFSAAAAVANNQVQIQNTINAAAAAGAGTVAFNDGVYGVGNGIVSGNNIFFRGVGIHGATLLLQLTAPASAVRFDNNNIVSNCGVSNLSIASSDITIAKNGIYFVDVSQCTVDNVMISSYPTGLFTAAGGAANGLLVGGRELGVVKNSQVYADQPLHVAANPHVGPGVGAIDSWTFQDLIMIAQLPGGARHVILFDPEVSLTDVTFNGHQNWIGGLDGFHWLGSDLSISAGLYISGVKDEQPGALGGFTFNIQPSNTLFNLSITNVAPSTRNAYKFRNIYNTVIDTSFYDSNTSTTKIALDADLSNRMITFINCVWFPDANSNLGAFATANTMFPSGTSTTLPANGVFYH